MSEIVVEFVSSAKRCVRDVGKKRRVGACACARARERERKREQESDAKAEREG